MLGVPDLNAAACNLAPVTSAGASYWAALRALATQRRRLAFAVRSRHPLHATIEEFAAEGYTHVECFCPRCRVIRLRPMSWLPKISMGLTIAQLSERLRCAECGGPLQSVKPWRHADVLGKPLGRRV